MRQYLNRSGQLSYKLSRCSAVAINIYWCADTPININDNRDRYDDDEEHLQDVIITNAAPNTVQHSATDGR